MRGKKHIDDFIKNKINGLQPSEVDGFEKVQAKMAARKQTSIALVLLIPFLLAGLYWLSFTTEQELFMPRKQQQIAPIDRLQNETKQNQLRQNSNQSTREIADQEALKPPAENSIGNNELNGNLAPGAEISDPILVPDVLSAIEPKNPILAKTEGLKISQQIDQQDFMGSNAKLNSQNSLGSVSSISAIEAKEVQQRFEQSNFSLEESRLYHDYYEVIKTMKDREEYEMPAVVVPEQSRWSLTLNVYPNYTFRDFKINSNMRSKVNPRYEDIIKSSEKGGFAFNVGVDLRYYLGDDLYLGTGLGFIQTKINGKYQFEMSESPVLDDEGNIEMFAQYIAPVKVDQGILQTYQFLQVPFHVSYQPWASKKIRLIIEGGLSYVRFLRADGETIDYATLMPKDVNEMKYNKNMASLDFKVGASFYPTEYVAFGLEPTLTYFNSSLYAEGTPVYMVPWSVGVNLNLRFKIL